MDKETTHHELTARIGLQDIEGSTPEEIMAILSEIENTLAKAGYTVEFYDVEIDGDYHDY